MFVVWKGRLSHMQMAVERAVLGMYYMLIVVEYGRYGLLCRQEVVEWAVLSL